MVAPKRNFAFTNEESRFIAAAALIYTENEKLNLARNTVDAFYKQFPNTKASKDFVESRFYTCRKVIARNGLLTLRKRYIMTDAEKRFLIDICKQYFGSSLTPSIFEHIKNRYYEDYPNSNVSDLTLRGIIYSEWRKLKHIPKSNVVQTAKPKVKYEKIESKLEMNIQKADVFDNLLIDLVDEIRLLQCENASLKALNNQLQDKIEDIKTKLSLLYSKYENATQSTQKEMTIPCLNQRV